jgi:2-dehydro-3-deoxyphosphogluconate aldolase/(4S)-4-hydroxy-2-oxoglutarate aldolase
MPTGGIAPHRESLAVWLDAGAACLGLGSQLAPRDDVAAERWDAISERSRMTLDLIAECRRPIAEAWA